MKLRQIILAIVASFPLAAQDPPSPIVFIYREQIKPAPGWVEADPEFWKRP